LVYAFEQGSRFDGFSSSGVIDIAPKVFKIEHIEFLVRQRMALDYRVFQITVPGKQTAVAVENGSNRVIVDVGKIVGNAEVIR
jgi:hypothetical protein